MRRMTMRQALSCESATGRRCRCRCGGLMHGRGRNAEAEIMALPEDDPHHALPGRVRKTRRQEQAEAGQLELFTDEQEFDLGRLHQGTML